MPTEINPSDCPKFVDYLKFLKGLTDKEVGNYLKLIGRGHITKDTVLEKTKITNQSQPYKLLGKLENAKLVSLVSNNRKKTYQMINPRTIFEEMKIEVESIDDEIGLLQEQYENTNFELQECDKVQDLKTEVEIEHELFNLKSNSFEIEFCVKEKSKIMKLKRFDKYNKTSANLDFILFKSGKNAGVILLELIEDDKCTRVSGVKINSKNLFTEYKGLKNGN